MLIHIAHENKIVWAHMLDGERDHNYITDGLGTIGMQEKR